MAQFRTSAARFAAVGVLAALLGACSDSSIRPTEPNIPLRFDVIPTPSQLIVPIGAAGSFTNGIVANNSGRVTTEFWDNPSADRVSIEACNVGFWATGSLSGDCANEAAGSDARQGGFSTYFGDGAGARDAAGFMFKGGFEYTVTLKGAYHGENSEVGWFTVSGGVYTLHPIAAWGSSTLDNAVVINSAANWGLYIKNAFNPAGGGCVGTDTHCSDATGGFTALPEQQFALMLNAAQSRYLVGAEDKKLELLADNPLYDSDYNDYIWWVDPKPVPSPSAGQGCSPGYWKNHSGWPAPYAPGTLFSSVFANAFPGKTLQQVVSQGGGGLNALGRQTVSALLNAASPGVNFELTEAQVISKFNAAYASGVYEPTKNEFEALTDVNGRICPLN